VCKLLLMLVTNDADVATIVAADAADAVAVAAAVGGLFVCVW